MGGNDLILNFTFDFEVPERGVISIDVRGSDTQTNQEF